MTKNDKMLLKQNNIPGSFTFLHDSYFFFAKILVFFSQAHTLVKNLQNICWDWPNQQTKHSQRSEAL